MPKRPSSDTTPDLFLAASTTSAKSPSIRQGKAIPDNSAAQTRDALPGDLARALKRLNDTEVDTLLAAATVRPSVGVDCRGRRRLKHRQLRTSEVHSPRAS